MPIARFSPLVSDRDDGRAPILNFIVHRVRKVPQDVMAKTRFVFWPGICRFAKSVYRIQDFCSKFIRRKWATSEVPQKRFSNFRLRLRQKVNTESSHNEVIRVLASAQGTGFMEPDFKASRRRNNSSRQASLTLESPLPSTLSSNATISAERSSTGRPRASVNIWSTRAFMRQSLALKKRG